MRGRGGRGSVVLLFALVVGAAGLGPHSLASGETAGKTRVKRTVKEAAKTGGHAVRDGALTVGRTTRDFFKGGGAAAKATWKANAAKTKATARSGGRATRAAAKGQ